MTFKNIFNRFKDYLMKTDKKYIHLIKNTSWITLNQIIYIFFGIILTVIFARFTTKEVFGNYNFLVSLFAIISIISIPGLNTSMLRSISRGLDGTYVRAVRLSFFWSLLGIPILFLLASYCYYFVNSVLGLALFSCSLFFPLIYSPNNWVALLQGKKKFNTFSKYSIIQTFLRTMLIIIAIFAGKGNIILIFLAYVSISALTNVVFYIKSKKYILNDNYDDEWKKSGYKLSINDFVNLSYDYLDKILIGIFLGPVELATYAIAVSVVSALRGSSVQITKVIYPDLFKMGKDEIENKLKKVLPYFLIVSFFGIIIIASVLPFLMNLLYTNKYEDSIFLAQIYCITIPFSLMLVVLNTIFIALHKENAVISFRILGLILIVALYFILIPSIGLLGAIISSIIYFVIILVVQYIFLKRY